MPTFGRRYTTRTELKASFQASSGTAPRLDADDREGVDPQSRAHNPSAPVLLSPYLLVGSGGGRSTFRVNIIQLSADSSVASRIFR